MIFISVIKSLNLAVNFSTDTLDSKRNESKRCFNNVCSNFSSPTQYCSNTDHISAAVIQC